MTGLSRLRPALSHRLARSTASIQPGRVHGARRSQIARGLSAVVHVLDTPATALPGHALSWCRAPPAHTAHPVVVARRETPCGAPVHHPLSPSRAAPAPPTHRASPGTARGVYDTAPPAGHGTPHAGAHPGPSPRGGTSGGRVRHGRGARRTP